jgi:hypothetical protein
MSVPSTFSLALAATIFLAAAPASAAFGWERQLSLRPGGAFALDTDAGSVTVTGDSASGATVTVTTLLTDFEHRFDIRVDETPGVVKVAVKRRGPWLAALLASWFDWGETRLTIHVPHRTAVDVHTSGGGIRASMLIGALRLHSSGGSVRAEDIEGSVDGHTSGGSIGAQHVRGDVAISTSGGGITVTDVHGNVRASTSGGGIKIESVTGQLEATTSGGGVRIRGAGGRVNAHSSGGPVTVAFAPGNGRGGVVSSSGGGVTTLVDPAVSLSVDASSSGGGVRTHLAVLTAGRFSRHSLHGDLNGGGALLQLRSSGGGIHISAAQTPERSDEPAPTAPGR